MKRITPGQTASADEVATSQIELNALLGQWNADAVCVYSSAPMTVALLNGVADYTVTPRPVRVEAWSVRSSSGQANGGVPLDPATYATVAVDRSATGARVKALNYDAAYPTASVHLYPKPTGGTLELWVWEQLASIADFTAALNYPPGYLQAITYALAVALAGKFATRAPLDPTVAATAAQSKAALASSNQPQHRTPLPQQAA